ncbi:hypothetical protein Tco_0000353 [Tanacetum coccineum]
MASLDYRLNPLFTIKECSSCGSLYNKGYCCTPDSSQQPLRDCPKCGNPVEGPNCQGCALWRKKLKEVWSTICHENGIYQDLLNTYESSDDDTNVVNAPREPFVVKQDPGKNSSQSPPQINHNCCYECGDSLDGIFCQQCTCKSCGKGAHIGYNCPPKAPIISNPEPCNQTIDEFPQTLPSFDPTCYSEKENSLPYVSKPNFVDDSPNDFNPPPQPPMYSCEFCGNDARYGHYCTPQVPFIYPEPCYNQDFNFPQDFHDFQQQYFCCENCGGPHETFQCQPMNEDYYHEQNSCYDSNSFGFDQFQPPQYTVNHPIFNAQNELLNDQNKLMEQMTSIWIWLVKLCKKRKKKGELRKIKRLKKRFIKIKKAVKEEQNQAEVMQELLIKLMDDLQILKGIQQEKEKPTAQSFTPYEIFSMIDDVEVLMRDIYTFLRKFSRIPFGVTPKVIFITWEKFSEIKHALTDKQYRQEDIQELMSKLLEDVRNINEELSEYINCPSWNRPTFYDDDDDEYTIIYRNPKAITPDL